MQHPTNRQASVEIDDSDVQEQWHRSQAALASLAYETYDRAVRAGIAKEVARAVLPEGLTPTTLYAQGTFRSWLHYLQAREEPGTQKEHRDLAGAVRAALTEHEPLIFG